MKKLVIMRHAKSSWKDSTLNDHDRPLNKRGERDAPAMGKRLANRSVSPDLIVSSTAVRAITTARAVAETIHYDIHKIVQSRKLYLADLDQLIQIIQKLDNDLELVFLFGHNPGMTELANHLGTTPIVNLPTCGFVELHYDCNSWKEIKHAKPTLEYFDYPKNTAI